MIPNRATVHHSLAIILGLTHSIASSDRRNAAGCRQWGYGDDTPAFEGPALCTKDGVNDTNVLKLGSVLFFLAFVFLGALILLTLFIGVVQVCGRARHTLLKGGGRGVKTAITITREQGRGQDSMVTSPT